MMASNQTASRWSNKQPSPHCWSRQQSSLKVTEPMDTEMMNPAGGCWLCPPGHLACPHSRVHAQKQEQKQQQWENQLDDPYTCYEKQESQASCPTEQWWDRPAEQVDPLLSQCASHSHDEQFQGCVFDSATNNTSQTLEDGYIQSARGIIKSTATAPAPLLSQHVIPDVIDLASSGKTTAPSFSPPALESSLPSYAATPQLDGENKDVADSERNKAPPARPTTVVGRRGDPRMHRAVSIRLAHPRRPLLDVLIEAGFKFPTLGEAGSNDRNTYDEEGVQLYQRKNQLNRRIRLVRRKRNERRKGKKKNGGKKGSTSKGGSRDETRGESLHTRNNGKDSKFIGEDNSAPLRRGHSNAIEQEKGHMLPSTQSFKPPSSLLLQKTAAQGNGKVCSPPKDTTSAKQPADKYDLFLAFPDDDEDEMRNELFLSTLLDGAFDLSLSSAVNKAGVPPFAPKRNTTTGRAA